jgi:hypothetical protein
MASDLEAVLSGITYKLLDPYKENLRAGVYTGNRVLLESDIAKLETLRASFLGKQHKGPGIAIGIDNINLLLPLMKEIAERPAPLLESVAAAGVGNGAEPLLELAAAGNGAAPLPELVAEGADSAPPLPELVVAAAAAAPANVGAAIDPCAILYDPCTREALPDFAALEKRIKELRKARATGPVGLYGLTNATTNYDFLMGAFSDKRISLDDLVSFSLGEGGQVGSDIYEVLCRMFVFFGGIDGVNPQQGGNYKFMLKAEASVPHIYATPRAAFEAMKCKASKEPGISDITLVRSEGARAAGACDTVIDQPYCGSECVSPDASVVQSYLMSVKWYRKKEKNAEHYDLEKLRVTADMIIPAERKPVQIIVFLKSKADFERAHQRAYRQYVRRIGKTFFGWDEDVKPFLQNKRREIFEEAELRGIGPATVLEERYFVAGSKPTLGLQLHQEIIASSLCNAIDRGDDNRYLIGVLPRGGKTYIAGGIIREYLRRKEPRSMNILWLTAAPTETRSQVKCDLIEHFQDFDKFEYVEVRNVSDLSRSESQFRFFFCSTQLLTQAASAVDRRKRDYLQRLVSSEGGLGLIFYDEAHKTGTGEKTKEEIDKIMAAYSVARLPIIFLTATYYNILFDYKLLLENTFVWDYTDVLKTRGLATETEQEEALNNLRVRFRDEALVNSIVERRQRNGESIKSMGVPYLEFPELYFISADFQEEALARFAEQGHYNPASGFRISNLFSLRSTTFADIRAEGGGVRADAYRIFENLSGVRNMVSLITPGAEGFRDAEEGGAPLVKRDPMMEPTILGRINSLSRNVDSRFRLDEKPTIMMFMPTGRPGTRIYYTLCAWAALLLSHPWWRENYEIACVVDEPSLSPEEKAEIGRISAAGASGIHIITGDNIKARITKKERDLHCVTEGVNPKGLVILAGQKLSMGVSLPCTDVVFLLNDSKSPDDIIQKMYRALTPSRGKKAAFVVDLNPVRSFAAVYGYTRVIGGEAQTSSTLLNILYDTYSWDEDFFEMSLARGDAARPQRIQDRLRQLLAEAEKDPDYRVHEDFGGIEKRVGENVRKFVDTRLLTAATEYLSERRTHSGPLFELHDGATAILKSGQLVISIPRAAEGGAGAGAAAAEPGESSTEEIKIDNYIETVTDFIKFLAITSKHGTLAEAIEEYISNDEDFQSNVNQLLMSRGAITRTDPRITEVLALTVKDLLRHSRGVMKLFGDTKSKVDEPSARKNAVLKLIHRRLTPRKKQKEEKGEVFTPIELVEDMLNKLPGEVWSNKDLKWLDPANGIGNFPVVAFYRLNEGLADAIPDEMSRRKHIIENMLYMVEIQSSNSRIARNILTKLCDGCTPNIWTTDSLKLTSESLRSHGWPEKFDIIMGNPPFNAGGLLKGGGTLWPKFVKLAFQLIAENGYITFIHPPGWRKFYDEEDRENQGILWHTIRRNGWGLRYLHISDTPPKHFPIVDYYVIHAARSAEPTQYNSVFNGIKTAGRSRLNMPFIPNMISKESLSIINKLFGIEGEKIHIVYNQSFKPTKSDEGKTGVPHYHYTSKSGSKVIVKKEYSSVPEYISKPKVLMTYNGGYKKGKLFAFYEEEPMGGTNNSMYMIVGSKAEGERIARFLNSNIITFLLKITQYSASPNHKNEFKILNQLSIPASMEEYHLTEEEMALITAVVGAPVGHEGGGSSE